MKFWKEFLENNSIKEDASANMASGGDIAGLGDDHPDRPGSGEPGFKIDGRRKEYRKHRAKLETAREKRKKRKELQDQKFADDIKNKNLHMALPAAASGSIPDTAQPRASIAFKKRTT